MKLQGLIGAISKPGIAIDAVGERTHVEAIFDHGGHAVRQRDEVFDDLISVTPDVSGFEVASAVSNTHAIGRGVFLDDRRRQTILERHVGSRKQPSVRHVVDRVEARRESATLPRRAYVNAVQNIGVAHVGVVADLGFVVAARVVPVRHVDNVATVPLDVVRRAKSRNDGVRVDSDQAAGSLGARAFISNAEVR